MVEVAHSNLCNFEKKIVFHHFGGKQEEKIVCDCLRNQKGFPLFPNTNKHVVINYVGLCPFLFGGVLWRGRATFFFPLLFIPHGEECGEGHFIFNIDRKLRKFVKLSKSQI
jgi:hypothetical protein